MVDQEKTIHARRSSSSCFYPIIRRGLSSLLLLLESQDLSTILPFLLGTPSNPSRDLRASANILLPSNQHLTYLPHPLPLSPFHPRVLTGRHGDPAGNASENAFGEFRVV